MTAQAFSPKLLTDDELREVADNPTDSMLFSTIRSAVQNDELRFERHGKWLVAMNAEAPAEHCWLDGNGQGCAGRAVKFKMVDGSVVTLVGPWHGNASDMYLSTGFDVRDRYWRRYIISIERRVSGWNQPYEMIGVLEANEGLMSFGRPRQRAQEIADLLGRKVYICDVSAGGDYAGWADPKC